MTNFDFRGLQGTAKKSSYYARPSREDELLKGVVGYGAVASVLISFSLAVLMSYLGNVMSLDDVAWPIGGTVLAAIPLLVSSFFLGGAPTIGRVAMALVGSLTALVLVVFRRPDQTDTWYLFIPLFTYAGVVAALSIWQLTRPEIDEEVAL